MNLHKLLLALTTGENHKSRNFDESLRQIISEVTSQLPEQKQTTENNLFSVRSRYLEIILYLLKSLKETDLTTSETSMSVSQQKTVKSAIEIIVSIGILPCLFPGIGASLDNMCPRSKQLKEEILTEVQKYDRLSSTVRDLIECFDEVSLRCALLPQLGPLLGALLQLSYAPLMKPSAIDIDHRSEKTSSVQFEMTNELYEKLKKDQIEFREMLISLIDNCPLGLVVKELMVILGMEKAPNWIRKRTRTHLINAIVRPNGIVALIDAVCGDVIDLGAHWNKLDTVARLVATSHGFDPDKYYDSVCSQMVKLLKSKNINHSSTIAVSCITVLYDHNPKVCIEKVIRVLTAPLRTNLNVAHEFVPRTETEVTNCIENLTKCFVPLDAKFKHPTCTLMTEIAVPLFCLYAKSRRSVSFIKPKIRDLLIHMMNDTNPKDNLFSAFLGDHENLECYGAKFSCEFGPTGGLTITGQTDEIDHEDVADTLFDLVSNDENLAFNLFKYLLSSLSMSEKDTRTSILENTEDTLERIRRKLAAMKLLSNLANTRQIQEFQIKNPEPIMSFIKSLFNEREDKPTANNELSSCKHDDGNIDVLYISLMLLKVILIESEKPKDWSSFNELAEFLTNTKERLKIPQQLLILVNEVIDVIKNQGQSSTRRYSDLSFGELKHQSEFEKALKDLSDPLLPVRAHGLMSLTKLLESKDPEAVAKKDIILCFFQENLKDDDSFIYLSAVNGFCALASLFPDKVITTLVQEYIDMPQRNTNGEISPEIRAKLGEILVKTTRSLGEICPAYKTILINGFLCATRDANDMVRASSLSCLGELCKVLGFRMGHAINEIIYCIGCIINTDKAPECRRAAVLVANLLIRGLGRDVLKHLESEFVPLYRALKFLRDNDDDEVLRLHAQLALEELDEVIKTELFTIPKLEKRIFLLP